MLLPAVTKDHAEAQQDASEALLLETGDYLILHNVACIYAELSKSAGDRGQEFEDLALRVLRHAVRQWRLGGSGQPSELTLIEREPAFSPAMRQRSDFQELFAKSQSREVEEHSSGHSNFPIQRIEQDPGESTRPER